MIDSTMSVIAISAVVFGNIVGWIFTLWHNAKSESRMEGKYEERLNSLARDMESLPCRDNPQFQLDVGAMIQKVNDIDRRLGRIEDSLKLSRE